MTFFWRSPVKSQKILGLQHDDLFLEILFLFSLDRRCGKATPQSLSYGIFAKTSGHFSTFFGAYAYGEEYKDNATTSLNKTAKAAVTFPKNKNIAILSLTPTLNLTQILTLALTVRLILTQLKINPNLTVTADNKSKNERVW